MAELIVDAGTAGKTCPYCRFPLKGGIAAIACDSCGTVHHRECWDEGGGCSVFGCRKNTVSPSTVSPPPPPPAVELARTTPPPPPAPVRPAPTVPYEPATPTHGRNRWRLVVAIVVVCVLVAGGAAAAVVLLTGGSGTATPPPTTHSTGGAPKTSGFNGRVAAVVRPLVAPQKQVSTLVAGAQATAASFTRLRDAASVLQEAVYRAQGAAGVLPSATGPERSGKTALRKALATQAAYALSLAELPSPSGFTPSEAQSISTRAARTQSAYGGLLREVPPPCCDTMPITGTTQLVSLASRPVTPPTVTPPVPTGSAAVTYDFVADSGGVGVRYRYSPSMTDLVPGNGPFEGDRVTIYCYTTGDTVKGNDYWAKVAVSPDYYVPATYLRYGHLGPPAGVQFCSAATPVTTGTPGVDSDVVAFSGGVGVRYRYSPVMSNLVPGNGPFEGDRVPVYCYTTGQTVRGNDYWVKIAVGPDRYVPATYLQYGHLGPPNGVRFC